MEQNEQAWQALEAQYKFLLLRWVTEHARFGETNESAEFFANAAWAQLWRYGSEKNFETLGGVLRYLKLCVGTVIGEHHRKMKRDCFNQAVELPPFLATDALELDHEKQLIMQHIWKIMQSVLQSEVERLVARELWQYGRPPREIERLHGLTDVSKIRRNIIDRLRRHEAIKNLAVDIHQK